MILAWILAWILLVAWILHGILAEGVDCRSEMAYPFSPVSSTLNYNLAIANIQIRYRC